MNPKWTDKSLAKQIAARIEACRCVDPGGRAVFRGWEFKEYELILGKLLQFDASVSLPEQSRLLWQSLVVARDKGPITAEAIQRESTRLQAELLKTDFQPYVLVTSMSASPSTKLGSITMGRAVVRAEPRIPASYLRQRAEVIANARRLLQGEPPSTQLPLRVFVSARTAEAAGEQALVALNLVRACWNLCLNGPLAISLYYGRPKPFNKLVLGPVHTVHRPGGEATGAWWYDSSYCQPPRDWSEPGKVAGMRRYAAAVLRRLRRISYGDDVKEWLSRYVKALDESRWEVSFLQLWGALEGATGTRPSDSLDQTVRRASFVFSEPEYHQLVLGRLRERRNQWVHEAKSDDRDYEFLVLLKRYVEAVLEFHLGHGPAFSSLDEAIQFLSFPADTALLRRRLELLRRGLRFRFPRSAGPAGGQQCTDCDVTYEVAPTT